MNLLFLLLLLSIIIFITLFSIVTLFVNGVSLDVGSNQNNILSAIIPNPENSVSVTSTGPQPKVIAPSNCHGSFQITTQISITYADFNLTCSPKSCISSRVYSPVTTQLSIANFPEQTGSTNYYKAGSYLGPVVINPVCNGIDYQPNEMGFYIDNLSFDYEIEIIDGNNFIVKRTFKHLGSANLTVDNKILSSISLKNPSNSITYTAHCKLGEICTFPTEDKIDIHSKVGNSFTKFYYNVPTFVVPFSSIPNSPAKFCKKDYIYTNHEIDICDNSHVGPCLSNEVETIIDVFPKYGSSLCDISTLQKIRHL